MLIDNECWLCQTLGKRWAVMPLKFEKITSSNTTPPAMISLLALGEQVRNGLRKYFPKVVHYLSTKDYGRFEVPQRKRQTCLCTNLNKGILVGVSN